MRGAKAGVSPPRRAPLVRKYDDVGVLRAQNVIFRPNFEPFSGFLVMRSASRCAVSSSRLIVLASLDSAGGGLGRARAVSRRGVVFSRFFMRLLRLWPDPLDYTASLSLKYSS